MAKWNGKSRGSVSGIKVFVFFIKNFGLRAAYLLLSLPVPYFVIAAPKASKALFYYFHQRLEFSWITSVLKIFQTYYVFGLDFIFGGIGRFVIIET